MRREYRIANLGLKGIVVSFTAHEDYGLWCKTVTQDAIENVLKKLLSPFSNISSHAGFIESIDLYPTLCELSDIPVPGHVEGTSILPIITGNAPGREFAIAEWDLL